jgi:hypothetical protein
MSGKSPCGARAAPRGSVLRGHKSRNVGPRHSPLWIVLLVSAMLLPFVPGPYDPLATSLSVSATG